MMDALEDPAESDPLLMSNLDRQTGSRPTKQEAEQILQSLSAGRTVSFFGDKAGQASPNAFAGLCALLTNARRLLPPREHSMALKVVNILKALSAGRMTLKNESVRAHRKATLFMCLSLYRLDSLMSERHETNAGAGASQVRLCQSFVDAKACALRSIIDIMSGPLLRGRDKGQWRHDYKWCFQCAAMLAQNKWNVKGRRAMMRVGEISDLISKTITLPFVLQLSRPSDMRSLVQMLVSLPSNDSDTLSARVARDLAAVGTNAIGVLALVQLQEIEATNTDILKTVLMVKHMSEHIPVKMLIFMCFPSLVKLLHTKKTSSMVRRSIVDILGTAYIRLCAEDQHPRRIAWDHLKMAWEGDKDNQVKLRFVHLCHQRLESAINRVGNCSGSGDQAACAASVDEACQIIETLSGGIDDPHNKTIPPVLIRILITAASSLLGCLDKSEWPDLRSDTHARMNMCLVDPTVKLLTATANVMIAGGTLSSTPRGPDMPTEDVGQMGLLQDVQVPQKLLRTALQSECTALSIGLVLAPALLEQATKQCVQAWCGLLEHAQHRNSAAHMGIVEMLRALIKSDKKIQPRLEHLCEAMVEEITRLRPILPDPVLLRAISILGRCAGVTTSIWSSIDAIIFCLHQDAIVNDALEVIITANLGGQSVNAGLDNTLASVLPGLLNKADPVLLSEAVMQGGPITLLNFIQELNQRYGTTCDALIRSPAQDQDQAASPALGEESDRDVRGSVCDLKRLLVITGSLAQMMAVKQRARLARDLEENSARITTSSATEGGRQEKEVGDDKDDELSKGFMEAEHYMGEFSKQQAMAMILDTSCDTEFRADPLWPILNAVTTSLDLDMKDAPPDVMVCCVRCAGSMVNICASLAMEVLPSFKQAAQDPATHPSAHTVIISALADAMAVCPNDIVNKRDGSNPWTACLEGFIAQDHDHDGPAPVVDSPDSCDSGDVEGRSDPTHASTAGLEPAAQTFESEQNMLAQVALVILSHFVKKRVLTKAALLPCMAKVLVCSVPALQNHVRAFFKDSFEANASSPKVVMQDLLLVYSGLAESLESAAKSGSYTTEQLVEVVRAILACAKTHPKREAIERDFSQAVLNSLLTNPEGAHAVGSVMVLQIMAPTQRLMERVRLALSEDTRLRSRLNDVSSFRDHFIQWCRSVRDADQGAPGQVAGECLKEIQQLRKAKPEVKMKTSLVKGEDDQLRTPASKARSLRVSRSSNASTKTNSVKSPGRANSKTGRSVASAEPHDVEDIDDSDSDVSVPEANALTLDDRTTTSSSSDDDVGRRRGRTKKPKRGGTKTRGGGPAKSKARVKTPAPQKARLTHMKKSAPAKRRNIVASSDDSESDEEAPPARRNATPARKRARIAAAKTKTKPTGKTYRRATFVESDDEDDSAPMDGQNDKPVRRQGAPRKSMLRSKRSTTASRVICVESDSDEGASSHSNSSQQSDSDSDFVG